MPDSIRPIGHEAPLVSVIMANYNGAPHLRAALDSVLSQSVSDIEILVADDASTDDSLAVAGQVQANDPRVRLLRATVNAGPGAARNRALDAARGTWVAVVDSDDILHPLRLERLIEAATALQTDAVADDLIFFQDDGHAEPATLLGSACPDAPIEVDALLLVGSDGPNGQFPPLGYLKPLFRRKALGPLRYREDIRIGEDHDFYLRYLMGGGRLHLLRESYYLYRRHSGSISHRLSAEAVQAMLAAQDDLPGGQSPALVRALAARRRNLETTMNFERLVSHLKARQLLPALSLAASRPGTLPRLARAVNEHFGRRRKTSAVSDEAIQPRSVVLSTEGAGNMADRIRIPADPADWRPMDWARLIASARWSALHVQAEGSAGLHALGYLPAWQTAALTRGNSDWPEAALRLQASGYATATPPTDMPDRRIILLQTGDAAVEKAERLAHA